MSDILVTSPFQPFTLPTQFKAVFNGFIYCGTVDAVDPSVSQVQVYLVNEAGDKVPVAQPLRTNAGGYLVYNGQPAKFVTDSNHSLLVQDSFHTQVWYAPDMASIDPEAVIDEVFDKLGQPDGASLVGGAIYADIRAYSGSADRIDCIGRTNIFDRANGKFVRDDSDISSADDDGTVLIDALGRRWTRIIIDYILPEWFGAKGDGVAIDTAPMQKTLDLNRRVWLSAPATYLIDRTITLPINASIFGESKSNSIIKKLGAATKQILVTAGALAGGYTGTIPSNVNAVLALGDLTSSRWMGQLQNFSLYGEKPTPEGHLCEFGIVNGGIVSDTQINDVLIYDCQYAGVLPVAFASVIENNRFTTCLHGFFINNGTSTRYTTNYAVKCRDYAHYIRDVKYSTISSNASDFLNDNTIYPDRTRKCTAYVFQSLLGCSVRNNGQEGTLGTNWSLLNFDHSEFIGNTSIRLGSDYVGAGDIAWLEMNDTNRNSIIEDNFSYDYNSNGLLFGGANPAKHHNILVEGSSFLRVRFGANVVRASRNGMPVEAGYLNNQMAGLVNNELIDTSVNLNGNVGLMPTITAEAGSDAVITYGANNRAQRKYIGGCLHISGVIDATITHTNGTSQRIGVGNIPQNNTSDNLIRIPVTGVDFGETAFLAGFIPNSFRINSPGGGGLLYSATNTTIRLDNVVSGQRFLIHYQGFYSI